MKKKLYTTLAALTLATAAFAAKPKMPGYLYLDQRRGVEAMISACNKDKLPADLVIPDGVKEIGSNAFKSCDRLKSVTIPNSVYAIHDGAFIGCTSLESVTIPEGVKIIGKRAFDMCAVLKEIQFGGTIAQWTAFGEKIVESHCIVRCRDGNVGVEKIPEYLKMKGTKVIGYTGKVPTDLVISEGVTEINYDAFKGCIDIESVSIPGTVRKINGVDSVSSGAFFGCT